MGSGEGADSSFPPPLSPLGVRSCEKILGRAKAFHPARRDKVVEGAKKTKQLFFVSLCALASLREIVYFFTASNRCLLHPREKGPSGALYYFKGEFAFIILPRPFIPAIGMEVTD